MVQWKALTVDGDTLAATICCCLNFQQGLKRDEPFDITGKIKIYPYYLKFDWSRDYDTRK